MPVLPANAAATYCPNDAIALAQSFGHGVPTLVVKANLCDVINSMMWVSYPWSWSVLSFTPINLSNGVQDYNPTDTNILRPIAARVVRTDITPNEWRELGFLQNLAPELSRLGGLDTLKAIRWIAGSNIIRFDIAIGISGTQTLQFQGEYQAVCPKIDETNLDVPFRFPDRYYNVFIEGLKWKIYQLADDPRAGTVQYTKNGVMNRVYTGQLGIFMDALFMMARTEDLGTGDQFMFPDSPFGVGRSYWPGIYGI